MTTYDILKHAHSGWRHVVLILLIVAFVQALAALIGKKPYTDGHRKINLFTLISSHIQVLMGLIMYFLGGWFKVETAEAATRYWKMEHLSMMIIAVILITIGNSKSKKVDQALAKHRNIALYFGLALLIILGSLFMMVKNVPGRSFF